MNKQKKSAKVVCIGFNKCATRSFYRLFKQSGYNSAHHKFRHPLRKSISIGRVMRDNIGSGKLPFLGFENYTFYSDLIYLTHNTVYEGGMAYREIFSAYPDTLFLFNTRDKEDWIQSRLRHGHGEFALRYMTALGIETTDELVVKWRHDWDALGAGLALFSKETGAKVITHNIDIDPIEKLITALNEFHLDPTAWSDTGNSRSRRYSTLTKKLKTFWSHRRHRSIN